MATQYDDSDFVDRDFMSSHKGAQSVGSLSPAGVAGRPPTREELEAQVAETQQKLAELRQVQERLERERVALEEARRRRVELQRGREEMLHHLTRGAGLLEEAAFAAQRDAEQMGRTLEAFREALAKLQAINEETWSEESWQIELTRALTTIENARMEWNAARLKFPVLSGEGGGAADSPVAAGRPVAGGLESLTLRQQCRLGLALTWPLALVALIALAMFAVVLFRR
jgi:hypothetical protein